MYSIFRLFSFQCFSKGYYFDPIMHDYSVDHANELLSQLPITIKGIDQTVVLFSGAEFIRKVNPCIKFQVFLLITIHLAKLHDARHLIFAYE